MRIDPVLHHRDPVLAHALASHGREWRPDLAPRLDVRCDPSRRLPSVEIYSTGHRLDWETPSGNVVHGGKWDARSGSWTTTFGMEALPDGVAAALVGRPLTDLLDVPGADAFTIASAVVTPLGTQIALARVQ